MEVEDLDCRHHGQQNRELEYVVTNRGGDLLILVRPSHAS